MNLQPYNLNFIPPAWTGHGSLLISQALWGPGSEAAVCLQRRLLVHLPCCLVVSLCQMYSFFFLGLDSQPNISDPWSRVTAFCPVSWWWLCCVLLGSEMIPAGLYFCTKPCKGLLEESFLGPWPILLLGSEGGFPLAALELIVTSRRSGLGSVWFLCGQTEEMMFPPADSQGSGLALWWLE